jgi:hypothetical protein
MLEAMQGVRPSKWGGGWSDEAIAWLRAAAGVNLAALAGNGNEERRGGELSIR